MGIGWHFFKEGAKKFTAGKFTSVPFLQAAKGPLAEQYKNSIPDRFGLQRLNVNQTKQFWENYRDHVASRLGFDQKQTTAATQIVDRYVKRMNNYVADNYEDIDTYRKEVQRYLGELKEPTSDIPYQRDRLAAKEVDLRKQVGPWLANVEDMNRALQAELNGLATEGQRSRGLVVIPDRNQPASDGVVKWVVLGAGVLLLLGLFTRVAALVAMGFLLSVIGTQPPWVPNANLEYFYYQMVEVLALFTLIVFAAGRYAGLDYIIYGLMNRRKEPTL
ncbi:MAG: hypothetical protein KDB23_02760 [Planctomycetales bacterium]|nr:hypothetical protein [Planctomycetales bacterium]